MKLSRRRPAETEPDSAAPTAELVVDDSSPARAKGRATPKRRDSAPRKVPVTQPPRNRKEAVQWQKQQASRTAKNPSAVTSPTSKADYRAALRRGDPVALPRRDAGPAKKLARDWVDSRVMASNFLLILFPVILLGYVAPILNIITLLLFVLFLGEWYFAGRRIHSLARARFGKVTESPMSLGFYAGSRAYMPRRWRMPGAQVKRGDAI
jgi:hypothetical protein